MNWCSGFHCLGDSAHGVVAEPLESLNKMALQLSNNIVLHLGCTETSGKSVRSYRMASMQCLIGTNIL